MNPEEEAREAARRIQTALSRLGFEYQTKTGGVWQVTFKSLGLDRSKTYALLEVDTQRLPRKVNLAKLTHKNTLHHLTGVVGKPVGLLNSTGLTYVVTLKKRKPKPRLPTKVELPEGDPPKGNYMVRMGVCDKGEFGHPLVKMGHLLVAGSTGSGKSAFLRLFLYQLLRQPLPLELYLVDIEGLTFGAFAKTPTLKLPIAESVDEAEEITSKLLAEIERRGRLYNSTGRYPENLTEYHIYAEEKLPWVVAIFDEFSALIEMAGKRSELYNDISQLALRARKYGITLVFAGQDFKADLLNTRITNQLRTRVQYRCEKREQSVVTLGQAGAEELSVPGRALVKFNGKITEVQTYWISKERIIAEIAEGYDEKPEIGDETALTDKERWVAKIAVFDLGGAFSIDRIYRITGPKSKGGVSYDWLKATARKWEERGWLESDISDPTKPRMVTEALKDILLGIDSFSDADSDDSPEPLTASDTPAFLDQESPSDPIECKS